MALDYRTLGSSSRSSKLNLRSFPIQPLSCTTAPCSSSILDHATNGTAGFANQLLCVSLLNQVPLSQLFASASLPFYNSNAPKGPYPTWISAWPTLRASVLRRRPLGDGRCATYYDTRFFAGVLSHIADYPRRLTFFRRRDRGVNVIP